MAAKKAAKKASPRKKATKKKSAKKQTQKRSRKPDPKPRVPWFPLGLAVICTVIWGLTSLDVAHSAGWKPVRAKALSHGTITTSGHDPGGETDWGRVSTSTNSYTVVSYEFDGIAYEQKVPGRLELGSITEGVVDPSDPGRWRWSENQSRWWIIVLAGLGALFFFRRAGKKWPSRA